MHSVDAIIVGGGPAGWSAALYLARYCRTTLVFDDGRSRARWVPKSHNVPGFADGVSGDALVLQMRAHAQGFGAQAIDLRVTAAARDGEMFVVTTADGARTAARTLIIATGLATDAMALDPDVLLAAVAAGSIRYCPICDGYEHRGKRIAVLGDAASAAEEALFLRTWSDDVTLVSIGDAAPAAVAQAIAARGVRLVHGRLLGLDPSAAGIGVRLAGQDAPLPFDVLYPVEVTRPRSALAQGLGAVLTDNGKLAANAIFGAGVDGLFGAGDIVDGLDQISVAMGHGAIAATRAHNWLRLRDGRVMPAQADGQGSGA